VVIRLSIVMTSFLCFRVVAKLLQDGASLAIMPPTTNLSGKTQLKCASSPTRS
jgi:flagellar biosynthesis protein FliP